MSIDLHPMLPPETQVEILMRYINFIRNYDARCKDAIDKTIDSELWGEIRKMVTND